MGSTFKSNGTAISDILKGIEQGTNQLPEFQRGWVWDDERIRALTASISNFYPVGALMFLEYGGDTVRFKYRPFTGASADNKSDILVLDGQQRLTSIYCAMYSKDAVPTQTTKKEPIKRYYYLDIFLHQLRCHPGIRRFPAFFSFYRHFSRLYQKKDLLCTVFTL